MGKPCNKKCELCKGGMRSWVRSVHNVTGDGPCPRCRGTGVSPALSVRERDASLKMPSAVLWGALAVSAALVAAFLV